MQWSGCLMQQPLKQRCWACREALASTRIQTPRIAVISNVDAKPHSDPEVIKEILALQASFRDGYPVARYVVLVALHKD